MYHRLSEAEAVQSSYAKSARTRAARLRAQTAHPQRTYGQLEIVCSLHY